MGESRKHCGSLTDEGNCNGCGLPLVQLDALLTNQVNGVTDEHTLLELQIKMVFPKFEGPASCDGDDWPDSGSRSGCC